jgi:hypothetical protein
MFVFLTSHFRLAGFCIGQCHVLFLRVNLLYCHTNTVAIPSQLPSCLTLSADTHTDPLKRFFQINNDTGPKKEENQVLWWPVPLFLFLFYFTDWY